MTCHRDKPGAYRCAMPDWAGPENDPLPVDATPTRHEPPRSPTWPGVVALVLGFVLVIAIAMWSKP